MTFEKSTQLYKEASRLVDAALILDGEEWAEAAAERMAWANEINDAADIVMVYESHRYDIEQARIYAAQTEGEANSLHRQDLENEEN